MARKQNKKADSLPLVALELGSGSVRAMAARRLLPDVFEILGVEERQQKQGAMCVEQGIITPTTRARLEEHEANAQRLDAEIAAERYAHKINDTTRDELIATLRLFQRGDIEDEDYRATLIDTFVRAVYVFDDKYKIIFHLGNGKEEAVTLPAETDDPTAEPEDPKSTAGSPISNVRTTETTLHQNGLIQTEAQIFAVGIYSFLLICPRA